MLDFGTMHVARNWTGPDWYASGHGPYHNTPCGCVVAPCGLVDQEASSKINPDCGQHSLSAAKRMRQMHSADDCPMKESSED